MIKKLLLWFKHNIFKEEHLKRMIQEDNKWLSHNTIAKTLTRRYMAALSEDWYNISFTDIGQLRDNINCSPHDKTSIAIDHMKDLNINMVNILYNSLDDDQKRIFIRGMRYEFNIGYEQLANILEVKLMDILKLFIGNENVS